MPTLTSSPFFGPALVTVTCILIVTGCANPPVQPPTSAGKVALPKSAASASAAPDKTGAPAAPAPDVTAATSSDTVSTSATFDNVELVDASLNGKLVITRVGNDRTEANLMTVFAGLKNKTSHDLPIEIQTVYKDRSDNPVTSGKASWIPITLKPHEETDYRSVAISEAAVDFLIRIRRAQPASTP